MHSEHLACETRRLFSTRAARFGQAFVRRLGLGKNTKAANTPSTMI